MDPWYFLDGFDYKVKDGNDNTSVAIFFLLNLLFKLFIFLLLVSKRVNSCFLFLKESIL